MRIDLRCTATLLSVHPVRMVGFLVGALTFIALAVPGAAFAGTYTWNLASDFTASAPGANPDHDQYGGTPWSYLEGSSGSLSPATFSLFPPSTFSTSVNGGLAAWTDQSSGASVGINPTGSQINNPPDIFPPGQIVVQPGGSGQPVAIGWTSSFNTTQTVTVNLTVSSDTSATAICSSYATNWNVLAQDGTSLANGTSNPTSSSSTPVTVAPGAPIYIVISPPSPGQSPPCDATGLSLQITAPGTPPSVTLTQPAAGSSASVAGPTFSGAAGVNFGDSSQVTLRVYSGNTVSGTPVQTVTVPRAGASWSASLPAQLALGTYTAQAEQDDVVGDAGLSSPVTFGVGVPGVTLNPLGSKPLGTSTPVLSGTAGTAAADQSTVVVLIFAGTATTGSVLRGVLLQVPASGQFSVSLTPGLADGTYTAVATQTDVAGNVGQSAPQTFSIDTQAPVVTLVHPGKGSRSNVLQLVFSGSAGGASFDSGIVNVALYKGSKVSGKPFSSLNVHVTGSTWSAKWPVTLPAARYTVQASQTDALGHVGSSAPHTFQVVPPPPVIGALTTRGPGRVSLKVSCDEPATDTCSGTVLVLTRNLYQPLSGGPVGRLTVMFVYIKVQGGQTLTLTRTISTRVAAVLRHGVVPVTISANLHRGNGQVIHATAREDLRRGG